ncbi:hypothetical protein ACFIOY_10830 [Bradyrhizobium sp. TZ2]
MRPELAARLHQIIKGESVSKNGVAGVAGVAALARYASKSLELRQLRPLRVENSNLGERVFGGVVEGVTERSQADEAAIIERAGMAADSVPAVYLEAWARLNWQRPANVTEVAWRQALDDGGRFLDAWGGMAADWQWAVGDIFDVPRAGSAGGLIWKIAGRAVEAFGPECGRYDDGEIFERMREATIGR